MLDNIMKKLRKSKTESNIHSSMSNRTAIPIQNKEKNENVTNCSPSPIRNSSMLFKIDEQEDMFLTGIGGTLSVKKTTEAENIDRVRPLSNYISYRKSSNISDIIRNVESSFNSRSKSKTGSIKDALKLAGYEHKNQFRKSSQVVINTPCISRDGSRKNSCVSVPTFIRKKSSMNKNSKYSLIHNIEDGLKQADDINQDIQFGMHAISSKTYKTLKNVKEINKTDKEKRDEKESDFLRDGIVKQRHNYVMLKKIEKLDRVSDLIAYKDRKLIVEHYDYDYTHDKDMIFDVNYKLREDRFKTTRENKKRIHYLLNSNREREKSLKKKLIKK